MGTNNNTRIPSFRRTEFSLQDGDRTAHPTSESVARLLPACKNFYLVGSITDITPASTQTEMGRWRWCTMAKRIAVLRIFIHKFFMTPHEVLM